MESCVFLFRYNKVFRCVVVLNMFISKYISSKWGLWWIVKGFHFSIRSCGEFSEEIALRRNTYLPNSQHVRAYFLLSRILFEKNLFFTFVNEALLLMHCAGTELARNSVVFSSRKINENFRMKSVEANILMIKTLNIVQSFRF